ncbi:TRAP transporter large permease [uncultured Mailhella sp.]|uniref:TRAP transporter large permease n=1 Tax=uncultured Mailhella sp. TaxID=1981031 RepID=UPI0025E96439|nr:TRAP transporter large permease [uncultured Mailhella sp.]
MENVLIAFGLMLVLLALTVPVAVAVGVATFVGLYLSGMDLGIVAQRMYALVDSFPLMAIPFFLLSGEIMHRGQMANDLLDMCRKLVGHKTGGLATVSILTCAFYAALCGSAIATTAAVGTIMIPHMVKDGYERNFAVATSVCAGGLGPIIPPSISMIMYGAFAGVSVTDMFISGIGTGALWTICFLGASYYVVKKRGYGVKRPRASNREILQAVWNAKWAIGVPVIILGGIYGGVATPTESGCFAVIYALFVECVIRRSFTVSTFIDCFQTSLVTIGSLIFIILTANGLGALVQYHNVMTVLTGIIHSFIPNGEVFILAMLILFLILGMFMEGTALIIILVPILCPIAQDYGINLIQFGQFFLISMSLGLFTPPIGTSLYLGCAIGDTNIVSLSKACMPFIVASLICLFIIGYVPAVSLFLL